MATKKEIEAEELIKYINALKELDKIHKDIFGEDKNLVTPELISQGIVKHLYDLEDYAKTNDEDGNHDAIKNNETYEIKATSSDKGTTTINLVNRADVLIWIYIDYSRENIEIKRLNEFAKVDEKEKLFKKESLDKLKDPFIKALKNFRVSITLKNVKWNEDLTDNYDFELSKLPPTLIKSSNLGVPHGGALKNTRHYF